MKEWVKILFRSKYEHYLNFFVMFVETISYRYRVIEVTDLVIESYPVIVIKVTVIEKG